MSDIQAAVLSSGLDDAMPIGSRHAETGLLLMKDGQLVLQRDDGGTWRLDMPRKITRGARHELLGRRVRITAIRAEFDLLDVVTIASV